MQGHHEASTDRPKILGKNGVRSSGQEDCAVHRSRPAGRDAEEEKRDRRKQRMRQTTAASNFTFSPFLAVTAASPAAGLAY